MYVQGSSSAVEQIRLQDGALIPVTDSDVDLGTSSLYFKDAYIDSVTTTGNVSIGGNLTVTGNATISGNLTFGDADTDSINLAAEIDSNVIPNTDNTYDLGSSSKEWKDIYIDGTAYLDAINFNGTVITSTAAELNILDGVTSTAAELNILDGVTATATEINLLDGVTSTTAELNILCPDDDETRVPVFEQSVNVKAFKKLHGETATRVTAFGNEDFNSTKRSLIPIVKAHKSLFHF